MIPENLLSIHGEEMRVRERALAFIADDPALSDHAALVEACMDALDGFRQHGAADEDTRTLLHLGIRLFNGAAAAWALLLSGYYQTAAATVRDLLETGFLLSDFGNERAHIAQWRTCSEKERKTFFGPAEVRKRLDTAAGFTEMRRAQVYQMFCRVAAHPHPEGFQMAFRGGLAAPGPMFEERFLRAVLEELAMRLVSASLALGSLVPETETTVPAHKHLLSVSNVWARKYLEGGS